MRGQHERGRTIRRNLRFQTIAKSRLRSQRAFWRNRLVLPVDIKVQCGWGIMKAKVMSMKPHQALCCVVLLLTAAEAQSYAPKDGFVPDSMTAVKIAEAVLTPVYGKEKTESERPFKAKVENGFWTVNGTLHCSDGKGGVTTSCVGGTAEVKLSKTDGRILRMIHYK
jgi:hypothetical protein